MRNVLLLNSSCWVSMGLFISTYAQKAACSDLEKANQFEYSQAFVAMKEYCTE
jgi:hypothetical protein